MAGFYHLSVNVISRSSGRSAVACAAYRSGQSLKDWRYGKTHDYSPRRGIPESGISAPLISPAWVFDREQLWNRVEELEKRKDAQLAREFVVAFPHQLDADQRRQLLATFIEQEFTLKGLVADWAIHAPNAKGDDRNHHAHIMVTLRTVSDQGFERTKDRRLNDRDQLRSWRKAWADAQNAMLSELDIRNENGELVSVDHRSYEDIGLTLEPTVHMGVHATSMERKGILTEIGDLNRDIQKRNHFLTWASNSSDKSPNGL